MTDVGRQIQLLAATKTQRDLNSNRNRQNKCESI